MRQILLAFVLLALAPVAVAQTGTGTPPATGAMGSSPARPMPPPSRSTAGQSAAENCGTPDEFKPCPPLPRHPLPYYPANKP